MLFKFKKILFYSWINLFLFLIMMVGIQNSNNKIQISFFLYESIRLPVGFLIGTSFICGSIIGSFVDFKEFTNKK